MVRLERQFAGPWEFRVLLRSMRFVLYGLIFAALIYVISGGHLFLLPLFFVLPLGGGLFHRSRRSTHW